MDENVIFNKGKRIEKNNETEKRNNKIDEFKRNHSFCEFYPK